MACCRPNGGKGEGGSWPVGIRGVHFFYCSGITYFDLSSPNLGSCLRELSAEREKVRCEDVEGKGVVKLEGCRPRLVTLRRILEVAAKSGNCHEKCNLENVCFFLRVARWLLGFMGRRKVNLG